MGSTDLHEFYANEFADDLLMPASDIRVSQESERSRREMARRYGVTLAAMNRRLERLELHPDEEAVA